MRVPLDSQKRCSEVRSDRLYGQFSLDKTLTLQAAATVLPLAAVQNLYDWAQYFFSGQLGQFQVAKLSGSFDNAPGYAGITFPTTHGSFEQFLGQQPYYPQKFSI